MEIENGIIYIDEDDKAFIREMINDGIIKDPTSLFTLRELAHIWYERGYEDHQEDEM